MIHVSYTPANVEQVYFPHAEVVGDVGPSLALLADRLEGQAAERLGAAAAARGDSRAHHRTAPLRAASRRRRSGSCTMCAQVMPEDGIVALDNGMYKIWFARNYRTWVRQHAAARQRAGDDGGGPALGDDGGDALSRTGACWRCAAMAGS